MSRRASTNDNDKKRKREGTTGLDGMPELPLFRALGFLEAPDLLACLCVSKKMRGAAGKYFNRHHAYPHQTIAQQAMFRAWLQRPSLGGGGSC